MQTVMTNELVGELQQESATTRRVLERVPAEKLAWRPHEKSMTLGQLALHIATLPAGITQLAQRDSFDTSEANFAPPQPSTSREILEAFDGATKTATAYLSALDDASASKTWRLTSNGREVFAMPRTQLLRTILLNHWYHHRGQLSVYLRLLDVPVPSIYGPSADENPFA